MSKYRLFVGGWCGGYPDWSTTDERGLSWDEAKSKMIDKLAGFAADECEFCRHDAAEDAARLSKAEPGRFEGFVDGDDYLIIPENEKARPDREAEAG